MSASTIVLEAEPRADVGKGASRRLRRLENKVPAIIYGGHKDPEAVYFSHNKILQALEDERIFASLFDIKIGTRTENVILKALQRHPYKAIIMHMDLQRVSGTDVLIKSIPIHFINDEEAPGIQAGGILNHTKTQLEVRCQAKDLPPFIEIDVGHLELDEVIHLSQIKLPKNVELSVDISDENHDFPVVGIHMPRVAQADLEPEVVPEAEGEEGAESTEGAEASAEAAKEGEEKAADAEGAHHKGDHTENEPHHHKGEHQHKADKKEE